MRWPGGGGGPDPRREAAVLAFVVVAVVGYAMLTIYAWGGAFAG